MRIETFVRAADMAYMAIEAQLTCSNSQCQNNKKITQRIDQVMKDKWWEAKRAGLYLPTRYAILWREIPDV